MKTKPQQALTDFVTVFEDIKSDVLQFLPAIFSCLVIFVIGILVAYFVKWVFANSVQLLFKALPERMIEKFMLRKNIKTIAKGIGRIGFLAVFILTIATILHRLGLDIASQWLQSLAKYLPNIIVSLVITMFGWKMKDLLSNFLFHSFSRAGMKHANLASGFISWSVFVISVLVSLEQIGVDMSLVVSISTVIVGVVTGGVVLTLALGSKATIADILSCYQLNRFFKVGQKIEVAGYKGTVESIGPTFVLIETEQGKVTLPGSKFNQEATLIYSDLEK